MYPKDKWATSQFLSDHPSMFDASHWYECYCSWHVTCLIFVHNSKGSQFENFISTSLQSNQTKRLPFFHNWDALTHLFTQDFSPDLLITFQKGDLREHVTHRSGTHRCHSGDGGQRGQRKQWGDAVSVECRFGQWQAILRPVSFCVKKNQKGGWYVGFLLLDNGRSFFW